MRTSGLSKPAVVITGATGIVGSAVMAEAIRRGHRPLVLLRDESPEQARARVRAVLGLYGLREAADEVGIVRGDIRRLWLGMEPRTAAGLIGCAHAFIHCAASTSLHPGDEPGLWESNVAGTRNVIDLLSDRGVPLYHVSTAYVAGARGGVVRERDLDDSHGFANAYERSKWHAESAVRRALDAGRVNGAVLRPGVIAGSALDGAITDFQHIYGFLRIVRLAQTRAGGRDSIVRLDGAPDTPCNLVPVDWTAKAIWHIIENEGTSGQTYHLADPGGATFGDLFAWVNHVLAEFGARFELVPGLDGTGSAFENMARAALGHYRPYTFRQPRFDMANALRATRGQLATPAIDRNYFDTIYRFACARRWQGAFSPTRALHPFTPHELEAAALPA